MLLLVRPSLLLLLLAALPSASPVPASPVRVPVQDLLLLLPGPVLLLFLAVLVARVVEAVGLGDTAGCSSKQLCERYAAMIARHGRYKGAVR